MRFKNKSPKEIDYFPKEYFCRSYEKWCGVLIISESYYFDRNDLLSISRVNLQ